MNTPIDRNDDDAASTSPSDDIRAGEYVLGVLNADERAQVQARIAGDAAFAALVHDWERRFSPWLLRQAEAAPSAQVWTRIHHRLGWTAARPPATTPWNNVSLWRRVAGLASAAGIAALVFGLNRAPVAPVAPPVAEEQAALPVTVLARSDGATGWIARIDMAQGKVLMVPVPVPVDASGRANELWIIPAGGAPQSLGFVSNDKAHSIAVPAPLRAQIMAGATLAITLEAAQGMPHAVPAGPVVAKGVIQSI